MIRSFSVIVPVLNLEKLIVRTLQSIEDSIAFFQTHYDGAEPVTPEVVVVNEGSTDRTLAIVTEFAQDKPHYKIVNHAKAFGIGPARNTGAKVSQGDILFFFDGDDLVFPEHIYLCYRILNHQPSQQSGARVPQSFVLRTAQGDMPIELPNRAIGMVRTGVYTQDVLHPHWKMAVENTIMQNLAVRRLCHDFVEGFSEAVVYKKIGCEDIAYGTWLGRFFSLCKVNLNTVEYIRYPGNNFDRQLQKFQSAPGDYQEAMSDETRQLHGVRQKIEQDKLDYLAGKFLQFEQSPEFAAILNWQQLANAYLNQQNFAMVVQLCEQGLQQEPQALPPIKNLLAVAYNNLGSALHQQQHLSQAVETFNKALALQPDFPASDLAKVHFNLATVLRDQGLFQPAADQLQASLQLEPQFQQAIDLSSSLQYQAQVAQKGYQFSTDWFSPNIPIWQQVVARFVNMPGLNVLEIGSWEGRSTCWMVDHVLTHESANLTCIDTFDGSVENKLDHDAAFLKTIEQRFDFNVARTGAATKVKKLVGHSRSLLRTLPLDAYDLVYIDGSHAATDVLEDTLLTWALVKIGGILIFDDYGFRFPQEIDEQPPGVAIDAFLTVYGKKVKILQQGYQMFLEKIAA